MGVSVADQYDDASVFFTKALQIIQSKGHDYAPKGIAMSEIFWTAAESNQSPDQIIWTMMRKHLGAVRTCVSGFPLKAESLNAHLLDIANFCAMLSWWTDNRHEFLGALHQWVDTHPCSCDTACVGECDHCIMDVWLSSRITP